MEASIYFVHQVAAAAEVVTAARPQVLAVVAPDEKQVYKLVWQAYHHPSMATLFDCKVWVTISQGISSLSVSIKAEAAKQQEELGLYAQGLKEKLFQFTRGKKALIAVIDEEVHRNQQPWDEIASFLCFSHGCCSAGSAVIMATKDSNLPANLQLSPDNTLTYSLAKIHSDKAEELVGNKYYGGKPGDDDLKKSVLSVVEKCKADGFSMRLLLHVLHTRPSSIEQQLQALSSSREPGSSAARLYRAKIIKLCYDNLTEVCRNCLLYLSIFPKGTEIRRRSLLKRWVAEGQVKDGELMRALDMAEHCFNELVARELFTDVKVDAGGRVKNFKVHDSVHDFITEVVKNINFGDKSLPPNLAGHLSVNNGINWEQVQKKTNHNQQQRCRRAAGTGSTTSAAWSCLCSSSEPADQNHLGDKDIGIMTFLKLFPGYSRLGQLKVMDLDGCQKLEHRHLKNICNNLFRLKYLSLRKTNVSKLPKEINNLSQLETLDISQTRVQPATTSRLLLPKLRHLLAGLGGDNYRAAGYYVEMPRYAGEMALMEELSRVGIPPDGIDRLKDAGTFKHLRKLGVVLHAKQDHVKELIQVISRLSESLRHLSIWVISPGDYAAEPMAVAPEHHVDMTISPPHLPPRFLENLSITGLIGRLPSWMQGHSLVEVSLRETSLQESSLRFLGQWVGTLRCLRLRRESYNENKVCLKSQEFRALRFLVIEESRITGVTFEEGAAPMLEKIVWKFSTMETFLGILHLTKLEVLEFGGGSVPESVSKDIEAHPNHPSVCPRPT